MVIKGVHMRQKRYISGILVTALLLCLTGCGKKDAPEEDNKVPVDKEVTALVIETENTEEDSQNQDLVSGRSSDDSQTDTLKENEPQEMTSPSPLTELNDQIAELIHAEQAKGTVVSVYAQDLTTGNFASVESQKQQSASLIKLFIAGCVYEHTDIMKTQEAYENETDELMRLMITISDNDAANTLVCRLGSGDSSSGMQLVNEYCKSHGFSDTYMGRLMLDFEADDDNYTSVNDCGHFLANIYKKELAGSDAILSYMRQQERTGKIPAGVPAGTETANKTGELPDVENDAAIIFDEHGAYTLCVILNQLPETEAGRILITDLSAMVYTYMGTLHQ